MMIIVLLTLESNNICTILCSTIKLFVAVWILWHCLSLNFMAWFNMFRICDFWLWFTCLLHLGSLVCCTHPAQSARSHGDVHSGHTPSLEWEKSWSALHNLRFFWNILLNANRSFLFVCHYINASKAIT